MTADEFENALHKAVGRPRAEMRTQYCGRIVTKQLVKEPGAHRTSWGQSSVHLGSPQGIKVVVNLNMMQGDLSATDYKRLISLAFAGIRRYWSRAVKLANVPFAVDVVALNNVRDGIDVKLSIENGPKYSRSNNLGILWVDARFTYNAGFFQNQTYADQDFMETSAHEFGHSVLTEFGGIGRSWTHEGSTSILQSATSSTPGYPQTGEINLMRYYNEKKAQASFQRVISDSRATEFDVLCLLWMSKLAF